jgi:hypothetical protein
MSSKSKKCDMYRCNRIARTDIEYYDKTTKETKNISVCRVHEWRKMTDLNRNKDTEILTVDRHIKAKRK